ncbi:MAG: protein-L-isoaspartate O-methyltransferase [Hyphomonadaceae bacterium]|nr:protein-L-isoaspartate O-methyltransferase [Hyphomonadaceae bacterium]
MIESQVRTNDVSDVVLQTAMRVVARELLVSPERQALAYAELEVPTPSGRPLWKPRDFAKLAQAAHVSAGDRVLVIGGAGGYSAAVFAAMGAIVTVHDPLASDLVLEGVTISTGPLDGPPAGPFDVVFVDGGVGRVPETWQSILAVGGRLCVIEQAGPMGKARVHTRTEAGVSARTVFDASPPALPGFEPAAGFAF